MVFWEILLDGVFTGVLNLRPNWLKGSPDFCTLDGIKEIRFFQKSDFWLSQNCFKFNIPVTKGYRSTKPYLI
jgi:G:T-mismatch repair DNA endonuclease (very short patch repair protein)